MEFGQEPPDLFIKSSTLEIRRGFGSQKTYHMENHIGIVSY